MKWDGLRTDQTVRTEHNSQYYKKNFYENMKPKYHLSYITTQLFEILQEMDYTIIPHNFNAVCDDWLC